MFDKFLKKVKMATYVLAHLNTLDVQERLEKTNVLKIYPSKSVRAITRFPFFNCPFKVPLLSIFLKLSGKISQIFDPKNETLSVP